MLIRYHSWRDRPPHRVALRLIGTSEQLAGRYADSTWVFEIGITEAGFELILDGQVVSPKPFTPDPTTAAFDVDEGGAAFGKAPIPIDDGRLQQLWFKQGVVDRDQWDVIVVGTGIGGGTVIAELARRQFRTEPWRDFNVLGLEAGSMLFTGHVANQPRVLFGPSGNGATALWNSLDALGSRPYSLGGGVQADGAWGGYQVFALGGRSLFWGGLCPRMDDADFAAWPSAVAEELRRPNRFGPAYYDRAEEIFGVNPSTRNGLERDCLRLMNQLYPGRVNGAAPVAIPRPRRSDWSVPDGMFSTAELLLTQRLGRADGDDSYGPPYIHLAEMVVAIERDNGHGWVVHGVDLRDGSQTRRRARTVVLSAGTVETPRIMTTSALPQAPETIGHYLTEHLMAHMWFEIPQGSSFYRSARAAHLLSRPGGPNEPDHLSRCNVQLQVNSDLIFDQTRMPGVPQTRTKTRDGAVAAQLVFMGGRDLNPDGHIEFGGQWLEGLNVPDDRHPPAARLNMYREVAVPDAWNAMGQRVLDQLDGEPLPELDLNLVVSASGAVSHEVGTMRMGASKENAVVNENLQVFDQPGLYVCDNSVFASSPAANPSLTLAALAVRLADHIWSGT